MHSINGCILKTILNKIHSTFSYYESKNEFTRPIKGILTMSYRLSASLSKGASGEHF